jgi:hypothetical protein
LQGHVISATVTSTVAVRVTETRAGPGRAGPAGPDCDSLPVGWGPDPSPTADGAAAAGLRLAPGSKMSRGRVLLMAVEAEWRSATRRVGRRPGRRLGGPRRRRGRASRRRVARSLGRQRRAIPRRAIARTGVRARVPSPRLSRRAGAFRASTGIRAARASVSASCSGGGPCLRTRGRAHARRGPRSRPSPGPCQTGPAASESARRAGPCSGPLRPSPDYRPAGPHGPYAPPPNRRRSRGPPRPGPA